MPTVRVPVQLDQPHRPLTHSSGCSSALSLFKSCASLFQSLHSYGNPLRYFGNPLPSYARQPPFFQPPPTHSFFPSSPIILPLFVFCEHSQPTAIESPLSLELQVHKATHLAFFPPCSLILDGSVLFSRVFKPSLPGSPEAPHPGRPAHTCVRAF